MYTLKQLPEDFIVKEISNVEIKDNGRYSYFKLTKKNWNTIDVIKKLVKILKIKEKDIGFAGSKDRNAVTEQIISFLNVSKEKILNIKIDDIELKFLGYGDIPISLGDLEGNHFEIIVRNLDKDEIENIGKAEFITNYFDKQRFSKNNVEIGRNLIKKDFGKAVSLIDNLDCKNHLEKSNNDFIGALKKIPMRLLRMYVNAYQSYMWNETVEKFLRKSSHIVREVDYSQGTFVFVEEMIDVKIPLIGFGSEELENNNIKEIIKEIMNKENLKYSDFIIKQIPELSLEGELRDIFVQVKDLEIDELIDDEYNSKTKKILIKFYLPKGSYATMVVRRLFS